MKKCKYCGAENPDDARFCIKCSKYISDETSDMQAAGIAIALVIGIIVLLVIVILIIAYRDDITRLWAALPIGAIGALGLRINSLFSKKD